MEILKKYKHNSGKNIIHSICLNSKEDTLYLCGNGALSIWHTAKPDPLVVKYKGMSKFFLSPDDQYGVYFTEGKMNVLEMLTLKKKSYSIDRVKVNSAVFSPDGRFILVGFDSEKAKLYNILNGAAAAEIKTSGTVQNVDFHTGGKFLLISTTEAVTIYRLNYNYEFPGWTDWDDGALPYLESFLAFHKEGYNNEEFNVLITELQNRGLGYIRPEGVRAKLNALNKVKG
jgi:WD40 repeat protein